MSVTTGEIPSWVGAQMGVDRARHSCGMRENFCIAMLCTAAGCFSAADETDVDCTASNCRRMITSCRVEPVGGPAAACWRVGQAPPGFDPIPYCVETCRRQGAAA